MPQKVQVPETDSFNQWRIKTNTIADQVGELDDLETPAPKTNLVKAVNEVQQFSIAMAIALG